MQSYRGLTSQMYLKNGEEAAVVGEGDGGGDDDGELFV